ncbi:MAG: FlgD immunoglobulin-like domain containing protein [Endomicrobiia bacterium]|nr:FlgD immunoglobulin-like domain containing protein [Endomicrobiia bacterium]
MRTNEVRHYLLSSRISGARAYIYDTLVAVRVLALCAGFVFFRALSIAAAKESVRLVAPAVSSRIAGISLANYPNPFDSRVTTTRIVINKPLASSTVSVTIYDLFGVPVRTYGRVELSSVVWDGRDDEGRYVAKGGYICVVSTVEGRIAASTKIGVLH